jgi:hypothetical protein
MPGDYRTGRIDQKRVGEPELADRRCDLLQLPFGVGPRIVAVWNEAIDRSVGDRKRGQSLSI